MRHHAATGSGSATARRARRPASTISATATGSPPASSSVQRAPALRAAARATLVLEATGNLSVTVVVGQVRSTAVDLLRGSGLTYEQAAEQVREAAAEVADSDL